MDERLAAELEAHDGEDDAFVEAVFRLVLRRPSDQEARERALAKLAAGTLSRATLIHELASSEEHVRIRELDDAVALGLGARTAGERIRWLQAPPGTDERVVEIPWVLSRLRPSGRVLEVGYAFAETAYSGASCAPAWSSAASTWRRATSRAWSPSWRTSASFRSTPGRSTRSCSSRRSSTSAKTTPCTGSTARATTPMPRRGGEARLAALRELGRVLRADGSLLVTVPLGEPGDHGWFRQDDESGWTGLYSQAGFFLEESEAYELTPEGWRAAPAFAAQGVLYGERGPAASAVLCAELRPGRLRRLLTPSGLRTAGRRRAARTYRRVRRDDG